MQLYRRKRKLDTDVFMAMVEENTQSMYKTAWAILRNEEDVADALQETIVKGFESLHTLRRPEFFKTWMMRILINNCLQIRKQRQRLLTFGEDLPEIPVEDCYDADSGFKELLNMVDEADHLLLTLYYADEFKVSEIAELLKMNVNTVKTRLSRAREKIRRGLYE